MPATPVIASSRRHPWPRALVRLRRVWCGVVEVASFFGAGALALGRVLFGRWPEAPRKDWLAPRGEPGLISRKARGSAPGSYASVNRAGPP